MPTRVLVLTALLTLAAYVSGATQIQPAAGASSSETQAKASPTPVPWPNLDRVKNPKGVICGLDGAPGGVAERAAQNRLMNRYHLPEKGFEQLRLRDLEENLPQGEFTPEKKLINFPLSDDRNNQRAVAVVGYVTEVLVLGCGAAHVTADDIISIVPPIERKGVESANCYVNRESLCTTQIILTPDPTLPRDGRRNVFVVEVTRRSRWLVKQNLLVSNIGLDWSTETLRKRILKNWVRFSGWLFFDQNYRERAWVTDPDNKIGKPNDRQTAWEIHPVMGIEVVPPPSGSGPAGSPNR